MVENHGPLWAGLRSLPEMSEGQFRRWADLLERRTGMSLPEERRSFLVTNVGARMREIGCEDYEEYFQRLHSGVLGHVEWATLVHRLTVHETRFYRHPASLDYLRRAFLPDTLEGCPRPYRIQAWSVGCASGEETYTLAMLLDQRLRELGAKPYVAVTGTDLSLDALAAARRGVYHPLRVGSLPAHLSQRYLEKLQDGRYRVNVGLRRRVCFAQLNILDLASATLGPMDIIYCQNVLIYFDKLRRHRILGQLAARLAPGGVLVLGSGEAAGWRAEGLQRVQRRGVLAYRRPLAERGSA